MSSTAETNSTANGTADSAAGLPAPPLEPIIPGCTPHKYYRVPDGLKALRRKQKVGIIFGYVGECYCGLQWNHLPEYPTVEEALMKALFETDMVSEINFSSFKVQQLLNFERASRTDKGVHALRNVVSVAIMLPYDPAYVEKRQAAMHIEQERQRTSQAAPPTTTAGSEEKEDESELQTAFSCEEAKRLLNLALPHDLHVYAVVPVTRSFNAYLNCGGRRYEYYLPTFSLMAHREYATDYFPSALAPSQPTLREVGFVPGKVGKCQAARPSAAPLTEEEEEAQRRKKQNSARKSKGHFPKRKRARAVAVAPVKTATMASAEGACNVKREENAVGANDLPPETTVEVAADSNSTHAKDAAGEEASAGEADSEDSDAEVRETLAQAETSTLADNYATHFHDGLFETMILFRTIPTNVMQHVARYRLPADQLEHTRRLFHAYEGTHCYHNFTPGGRSYDASCHRFIRRVSVSDPFVVSPEDALLQQSIDHWSLNHFYSPDERVTATYEEWLTEAGITEGLKDGVTHGESSAEGAGVTRKVSDAVDAALRDRMRQHIRDVYKGGIEVVRVELDGQSFMLNQIRKMIGAVVCIAATGLPDTYIHDVLLRKGIRRGIPMAPANGLFLSFLDFSGYNRRLERIQNNGNNGTGKGSLDVELNVNPEEVEEQRRRIIAVVLRNEMAEDIMGKWMRSLRHVVRLAWKHDIP
ncbi:hypothetical protein ABB37_03193 [Leptomonas pyrrhocoris]|uniref:Pseudouridine synthase I TruA alpha/beta domain-containing protein n=1 Tax=Leptomonas pyrrhocoris TaxID=157538 RepID=A0A0N1J4Z7_LEPPY|nr:hypothetical protein ABB37_03193 [Leptomonas pyrrhocoris]KPA82018.1 hypothetical protein ABB37_03193 [Leptomonas pyrrhocoris]|eukprot:XP_015660457.1 hypothetical protein ABB37_03193 [Leptomonas pyrrhocoris]